MTGGGVSATHGLAHGLAPRGDEEHPSARPPIGGRKGVRRGVGTFVSVLRRSDTKVPVINVPIKRMNENG